MTMTFLGLIKCFEVLIKPLFLLPKIFKIYLESLHFCTTETKSWTVTEECMETTLRGSPEYLLASLSVISGKRENWCSPSTTEVWGETIGLFNIKKKPKAIWSLSSPCRNQFCHELLCKSTRKIQQKKLNFQRHSNPLDIIRISP